MNIQETQVIIIAGLIGCVFGAIGRANIEMSLRKIADTDRDWWKEWVKRRDESGDGSPTTGRDNPVDVIRAATEFYAAACNAKLINDAKQISTSVSSLIDACAKRLDPSDTL